MTERRNARRYDLSLPIIVRIPAELTDLQEGKTRDISTRGLYFVTEQDLQAGSELDITLTLPAEITHGSEVFVRAAGKVVRVEPRTEGRECARGCCGGDRTLRHHSWRKRAEQLSLEVPNTSKLRTTLVLQLRELVDSLAISLFRRGLQQHLSLITVFCYPAPDEIQLCQSYFCGSISLSYCRPKRTSLFTRA